MPIVTERPRLTLEGRYGLKEAAKILGIGQTTLDRWTRDGRAQCGVRTVNGRRYWTGRELMRLWVNNVDYNGWRRNEEAHGREVPQWTRGTKRSRAVAVPHDAADAWEL